jgi:hypothetical protein
VHRKVGSIADQVGDDGVGSRAVGGIVVHSPPVTQGTDLVQDVTTGRYGEDLPDPGRLR